MEGSLYKELQSIFRTYRGRLIAASVMVVISNALLILNPLIFRQAILAVDKTVTQKDEGVLSDLLYAVLGAHYESVWAWAAVLLFVALTSASFKYQMRMRFISVSRDAEEVLRSKLFEKLQHQSQVFFDKNRVGALMSRLTNDIGSYREVLGGGVMYPIHFATLAFPALAALFYLSPPMAMLSLLPVFVVPLLMVAIRHRMYTMSLKVQDALADLSTMAQEDFSAIRLVKSYVVENPLLKRFSALCKTFVNLNVRLVTIQGLFYPFLTFFTRVTTTLLVAVTAWILFRHHNKLGEADFISFMWIQSYLFVPVLMLGWILPLYERGRASYDRLYELYQEPIEVADDPALKLQMPARPAIEIKDLSFAYPGTGVDVVNKISLNIPAGCFVGITGPVGAGKTTLLRLLNHDYEVPEGTILIGGNDIRSYSLSSLRKSLVLVEQVPFLFSKTIAENMLFSREDASRPELEAAAALADLTATIQEFPDEYDTLVGERGVTLSGGQKQRLALARAFLVERDIVLLDDSFASVDAATERKIFDSLREEFKGKTVILVTHRISLLEKMDKILYMQRGKVIEEGRHASLVAQEGNYAALVELQSLGNGNGKKHQGP